MTERLEILITAKDEASKALGKIANFSKGAFKTSLKIGGVGATALAGGLTGAVIAAMDAETSIAKLESVIKSTGGIAGITSGEAQALADSLASVTKFSDETIQGGETLLLTFTNIGEDVFPRATETMLNMGEAFGNVDGAAIQLGKALNDPVAGIGALAEVGVSFTQEQKDMVAAMMEAGDVAGAQAVILDELEKEFGGMARAAGDTAAGKLTIFKNKMMDVVQTIGGFFLPVLTRVLDRFIEFTPTIERFVGVLSNIVFYFEQGRAVTDELAEALTIFGLSMEQGQVWADRIFTVKEAFTQLWDTLSGFVTGTVIPFVQDHLPAFKGALLAVGAVIGGAIVLGGILTLIGTLGLLLNPITLIIAAVALFGAAWAEDWLGIRTTLTAAWNDHIKPALDDARNAFEVIWPAALEIAKYAWENTLKPAFENIAVFVAETLVPALLTLAEWFSIAFPFVVLAFEAAWNSIVKPVFEGLLDIINNWVLPILDILVDGFATGLPAAFGLLQAGWDGVAAPVFNALEKVLDAIAGIVEGIPAAFDRFVAALGKIQIPQALYDIAAFVQDIVDNLGIIGGSGSGGSGGGARGFGDGTGGTSGNNAGVTTNPDGSVNVGGQRVSMLQGQQVFNLTVNTSGGDTRAADDFKLMQAWAGV